MDELREHVCLRTEQDEILKIDSTQRLSPRPSKDVFHVEGLIETYRNHILIRSFYLFNRLDKNIDNTGDNTKLTLNTSTVDSTKHPEALLLYNL